MAILLVLSILRNHNKYMSLMEEQKSRVVSLQGESISSDTIPSFLLKTYEILENDKYNDIICWTKNGEGFIVKKTKEFSDNVLPIYFRHNNYTSFVRQLNMYDFHKTRQENHENAFKNVMFKRGFKHLLKDIQRKDYKKNKENSKQAPNSERNALERQRDALKSDKNHDLSNDLSQVALSKLQQSNHELEKRALVLAQLRQMPQKQVDLIKLLDVLFDCKKLQRQMLQKLNQLQSISLERIQSKKELELPRFQSKVDWQSTEAKMPGEGKDSLTTYSTLFSSFRQA